MGISGYTTTLPQDVLLDSGVLYVGSNPLSASKGGLKFDPKQTRKQLEFDGMRAPIVGNDRTTKTDAVISGKILVLNATTLPIFEPGVSSSAPGSGVTSLWVPKSAGQWLAAGDYITNLRLIFARGDNSTFAAVLFAKALCEKWNVTSKDEVECEIDVEFHARLDMSVVGAKITDIPYNIELRSALP